MVGARHTFIIGHVRKQLPSITSSFGPFSGGTVIRTSLLLL